MTKRWTKRPEGSNWGEFGEDDQLGSLNYIDSGAVLRAVKEVKEGRWFSSACRWIIPAAARLRRSAFRRR